MKKMKLFCGILIGLLILSSCSSDDNNENNSSSEIEGTWGTEWDNGDGISVNPKFTFLSNGDVKYYTYFNSEPELEEIGTWSLNMNTLIMEFPENVLIKFKNEVIFVNENEIRFEEIDEDGFSTWSAETYFKTDDPNLN